MLSWIYLLKGLYNISISVSWRQCLRIFFKFSFWNLNYQGVKWWDFLVQYFRLVWLSPFGHNKCFLWTTDPTYHNSCSGESPNFWQNFWWTMSVSSLYFSSGLHPVKRSLSSLPYRSQMELDVHLILSLLWNKTTNQRLEDTCTLLHVCATLHRTQ